MALRRVHNVIGDIVSIMPMAMLALFGVGFWLLVLRPAKAKQALQQQLVNSLKVGDKIMTTAGLFGEVVELLDGEVGVEVAPGVTVRMVRAAVARVIPADDATADLATDGDETGELVDVTDSEAEAGADSAPVGAESVPGSGPRSAN